MGSQYSTVPGTQVIAVHNSVQFCTVANIPNRGVRGVCHRVGKVTWVKLYRGLSSLFLPPSFLSRALHRHPLQHFKQTQVKAAP